MQSFTVTLTIGRDTSLLKNHSLCAEVKTAALRLLCGLFFASLCSMMSPALAAQGEPAPAPIPKVPVGGTR